MIFTLIAYAVTEDAQLRELDGPSTNILSEIISKALPPEKKDKLVDLNNVSNIIYNFLLSKSLLNKQKIASLQNQANFISFLNFYHKNIEYICSRCKMVVARVVNQLVHQV